MTTRLLGALALVLAAAVIATSARQIATPPDQTAPGGTAPEQTPTPAAASLPQPFDEWMQDLLAEARQRGFSAHVLDETLGDVTPLDRVIESDRRQAELMPGFDRYVRSHVTPLLVRRGQAMRRMHAATLLRIADRYGVPPRILVAIWGIESRFGRSTGRVPLFRALATLAWEPRRSAFFRGQLFDALTVVERGYIDAASMKGSWAGAMGQPQFMPSSYLAHAVDFDGDGRRDIWRSTPDALASMANYLQAYGWHGSHGWGVEVRVPAGSRERIAAAVPIRTSGCYAMRNMTERVALAEWRTLGVTAKGGGPLPRGDTPAGLVQTGTRDFLVYDNYDAILGYNCAHYYALSVVLLADQLR